MNEHEKTIAAFVNYIDEMPPTLATNITYYSLLMIEKNYRPKTEHEITPYFKEKILTMGNTKTSGVAVACGILDLLYNSNFGSMSQNQIGQKHIVAFRDKWQALRVSDLSFQALVLALESEQMAIVDLAMKELE